MSGFKDWKLRSKVFVPALATMVILSVALGFVIYRQEKRSVIAQARQTARSIGAQIAADRAMYTEKVVQKLVAEHSDITFADMKNVGAPRTLPLPASFVHLTSNVVNAKGLHTVDLLSLWNINPDKKPQTDDVRHALEELVRTPDQPQEILVDQGPSAHFVSVTADMASAQGCVDCHNRLPESPKHDFRLGDVMGGLMVSVPLTVAVKLNVACPVAEVVTEAGMVLPLAEDNATVCPAMPAPPESTSATVNVPLAPETRLEGPVTVSEVPMTAT